MSRECQFEQTVEGLTRQRRRLRFLLAALATVIVSLGAGAVPLARTATRRANQVSAYLSIPSTAILVRSGERWQASGGNFEHADGQLGVQVVLQTVPIKLYRIGSVPLFQVWWVSSRYETITEQMASAVSGRSVRLSPIPRVDIEDWEPIKAELTSNAPPLSGENAGVLNALASPIRSTIEVRMSLLRLGLQILAFGFLLIAAEVALTVRFLSSVHRYWIVCRRLARARTGACVRCGYELSGQDQCPECGTLVDLKVGDSAVWGSRS